MTPKRSSENTATEAMRGAPAVDMLSTPEAGTKVIRGGVLRMAGYAGGVVAGVAATPFVVRHLGVEDFGRFVTITSLIFIVGGLTEAGLSAIGVREFATRAPREGRRFLRNLLGMRIALTLAGVAAATGFGWLAGYERSLIAGTLVAGLALVITNIQYTYSVPLNVDLKLGWVTVIDLVRQFVTAVLLVAFVAIGASLLPFFAAALGAGVLALALTVTLVRGRTDLVPAADLPEWRRILRVTLPYAAATALGVVYYRVAVILMSLIASEEETGYFSVAFRIVEILSAIPWLLISSAFPILARAARDDQDRLQYGLQRLFDVSAIFGVWLAIAIYLGAGFAIQVVGGAGFGPSTDALRILGLAMIGTFFVATWGYALLSIHRHTALLVCNLMALAVGAGLTLTLVPALGAVGAGIATAATEIGLALFYIVALGRARRDLRASAGVLGPVAAAAAGALACGAVVPAHDVVSVTLATLVYFAILAVLKAIPPEIKEALSSWRRPARPA